MKLSVITVCQNARATIAEAVESVHGQTYADVEHIVVDGASDDGTLDILHSNSSFRLRWRDARGEMLGQGKGGKSVSEKF